MENNDIENMKKKKGGIKLWVIAISIAILGIMGIGGYFVFQQFTKEEIPQLEVFSTNIVEGQTMLDTKFKILSDLKTTTQYITQSISIEPSVEYEIKEVSDVEYEIIPSKELNSNSIYNVVYNSPNSKYKWSFQTEKIYSMTGIYPINEAMNVETNSVIELTFSYIPNDNIQDFFTITPDVEGTFKYDGRTIRFIPKAELESNAKYEISVKKGFGNTENDDILHEDLKSIFYTSYEDYNKYPLDIKNIFTFTTQSKIELPFDYPSYARNLTDVKLQIYKYNSENDFVTGIMKQQQTLVYNSLVEISTRGLSKILDVKYEPFEIREDVAGYGRVIDINKMLDEGYYLVTIQENGRTYYVNLQINNMMGYVSYYDNEALLWINSSSNNSTVSDATIYRNGEFVGKTNSDGILRLYNFERAVGNYNSEYIKVEKDNQVPLYMFFLDWYNGDVQYVTNDMNTNIYTFIDRENYKEGETVNLWGYIKNRQNVEYKNVSAELCQFDYSTVLETKQMDVDQFGAFTTNFQLSGYDNGYYYIKIYANGKVLDYKYFEIRQYDTKNYNVEAKLNKKVVFAGEELQLDLTVTLFDGTPIGDTEFKYTYFYGNNKKTGKVKTDVNGVATAILDTKYNTSYGEVVYANVQIFNEGVEAEFETEYLQFLLLPKKETYNLECRYDKANNTYVFNARSYMYDKNKEEYVGQLTNKDININVEKYERVKVLDYVKYDENTKTNVNVYKIEKRFLGTEQLTLSTKDGIGQLVYANPIPEEIDGYIQYTSTMTINNKDVISDRQYTYIGGIQTYSNGAKYTIDYDYNKSYKIGDTVKIKVLENMQGITDDVKIMHIIKSLKGTDVIVTDKPEYSFVFTKDYGTDIFVKTYVFDSVGIYDANMYNESTTYLLDKSELELDVDIAFDKASYKPGEDATITVTTKYKGNPVEASLNICAIDESYLAYYKNAIDIVSSLRNYYYFTNTNEYISHEVWGRLNEGGGGGDDAPRQTFSTTAFFEKVVTDENGKATLSIKWPDNITSWGVLAQGVSKQYTAGQVAKTVSVTLPFFVTPIYKDSYLVVEEPSINIRANGINVKNGDDVTYIVELTLPDGSKKEENISSVVGQYASYQLPSLQTGIYEIKVYGKCNDYSDTVIHEFDVKETLLSTTQLKEYDLKKEEKINNYATVSRMYLYNTSTEKIVEPLLQLVNLPNIRNDQIVISKLARQMLSELTKNTYMGSGETKFFGDEGIALINNAQNDLILTTKILSTGYSYVYKEGMIRFLESYLEDSNVDVREKLIALWGMASLKQPILLELHEYEKQIPTNNIYERVILGLAYADIGDFNNANKILNNILPQITTSNAEVYEYVTILAIKLNNENANNIYEQYLTLDRPSEFTNFVKLFYIQNQVLSNVKKASVTLNINGKNEIYDLKDIGITIVDIKQNENVQVVNIDKNVGAKLEQYIPIDKTISSGVLNKKYIVNDKETNVFKVGDIVTTRIYIDYDKLNENIHYFNIEDILPNCMVYLQEGDYWEYSKDKITIPNDVNGSKISFVVSNYINKPYIEYKARVISNGNYISDGTILKTYDNVIYDYISAGNIEVK